MTHKMSKRERNTLYSIAVVILLSATGCSTVPDWSPRESREVEVIVHYSPGTEARTVSLPCSTDNVLILRLDSRPDDLRETFTGSQRELVLPGGAKSMKVHCRYRLFRRHAPDGTPLPWTPAKELFPGANKIVDRNS